MKTLLLMSAAAVLIATSAARAADPQPAPGDWRGVDPANTMVIDTNKGRVIVELTPLTAPQSATRLRELARSRFFDGRSFFRVIDDFMDQTGDPTDTGTGGSTKPDLPAEFTFRRDSATPMTVIAKEGGHESGFVGSLPVVSQVRLPVVQASGVVLGAVLALAVTAVLSTPWGTLLHAAAHRIKIAGDNRLMKLPFSRSRRERESALGSGAVRDFRIVEGA